MNFLDLLFPKRCVGCGRIGKYFCDRCASTICIIGINEAICPVCEKPAIDGATHPGCRTRYTLDGLTSFFRYDGVVRKAVKAVKYRRVFDLAKEFVNLIPQSSLSVIPTKYLDFARYKLRAWRDLSRMRDNSDKLRDSSTSLGMTIAPLPLHWLRQRDRGFNQAEALGKLLAWKLRIPLRTDMLRRVKMTAPQVEMKKREDRLKNMEHVFAVGTDALKHRPARHRCAQALAGGRIDTVYLFDDVFTTGATMRAAANVLKRAGVKFVWGVTMAR